MPKPVPIRSSRHVHHGNLRRLLRVTAAAALLAGCAVAPTQEMSDARQALQAAREAGADRHAPAFVQQSQTLLEHAEKSLSEGKKGFSSARSDALTAKETAIKGRSVAEAILAAKSIVAEAVAVGALSDATEKALRGAVTAAKSGDDVRAIQLANEAQRLAEEDLTQAGEP